MFTTPAFVAATWLLVTGGAAACTGAAVARPLSDDRLERVFIASFVGVLQIVGIGLTLGVVGLARPTAGLVTHVAVTLVVIRLLGLRTTPTSLRPPSWFGLLAGASAATVIAAMAVLSLQPGPTHHVDTGAYIYSNLSHIVSRESVWGLAWQSPALATATHPGNALLGAAWLTGFGLRADELALLLAVPFAVLAVLASAVLTREVGGRPAAGAATAVVILSSPLVFTSSTRSLESDLAAAAMIVTAAALVLRHRRAAIGPALPLLAGAALGLAVGAKYTAPVPATLVVLVAALSWPRRDLLWLAPGAVILAAPWFVRNLLETGNPLFPLEVSVGDVNVLRGADTPLRALDTPVLAHIVHLRTDVLAEWFRVIRLVLAPAATLAVVGIIGGAVAAAARRHRIMAMVTMLAAGCMVSYSLTPFTGGGEEGNIGQLGSNLRYALPALLLAGSLAATILPRVFVAAGLGWAFVDGIVRVSDGVGNRSDIQLDADVAIVAGLAALLAGAVGIAARPKSLERIPRVPAAATLAVAVVVLTTLMIERRAPLGGGPVAETVAAARAELALPTDEPVLVLWVSDVRPLLGEDLRAPIEALAGGGRSGERPILDAERLDAELDRRDERILVTQRGDGVRLPEDWLPPRSEWCEIGPRTAQVHVYISEPCDEREQPS